MIFDRLLRKRKRNSGNAGAAPPQKLTISADRDKVFERIRTILVEQRIHATFEILHLEDRRHLMVSTIRSPESISLRTTRLLEKSIADAIAPKVIHGFYWRTSAWQLRAIRRDEDLIEASEATLGEFEQALQQAGQQ